MLYRGPGPSLVTGVLLWLVCGSGTVYRLHCVIWTAFTASESSWIRICLAAADAHCDYVFARYNYSCLLTYLFYSPEWQVFTWTWSWSVILVGEWDMEHHIVFSCSFVYNCSSGSADSFYVCISVCLSVCLFLWMWSTLVVNKRNYIKLSTILYPLLRESVTMPLFFEVRTAQRATVDISNLWLFNY